jgi:hypothetical protein
MKASSWRGVAEEAPVGQLEGENHEACGGAVEPAAANSGDHFCERTLDGGAVFEAGQVEDRQPWLSSDCTRAAAGGVVVVAELLAAEGGRAAGLAGGLEVMAGGMGCGHGGLLHLVPFSTCCAREKRPRVLVVVICLVKRGRPSADAEPSLFLFTS